MPRWLASYGLLMQWQTRRLTRILPLVVLVQALYAVGVVVGFGFLLPEVDPQSALYLSTGAPTLQLIILGLTIVPQQVAQAKSEGSFAYLQTLPVPRIGYLAADVTIWLLVALPGMALAIAIATLRYDLNYAFSPLLIPAVLLVTLSATGVGYAIAVFTPLIVAQLIAQMLVFGIVMFSPINFPADRLPGWLATFHRVLPTGAMVEVMRGTMAQDSFSLSARPFIVLSAWSLAGLMATYSTMARRQ